MYSDAPSAETVLAVGDLLDAIPTFWNDARWPMAIVALLVGAVCGVFGLVRGFGTAMGRLLGGIACGAVILGGIGLMGSVDATVSRHTGGVNSGQYGR
ncbi:hypothetical protein AWC04_02495 [Mycolicibacterium fallax]|uniref:Uncharacterized protein n=1 Tax=Mycolicibacterium fallax TaxID=1793 RepID=A0A1X1RK48_MYCFA|nr:hypothetical protein AWC04_02495 [Mycolicibacterium fallax]